MRLTRRQLALSTPGVFAVLVATLFNPLRTRVQSRVDRRFHRARYDTDLMIQRFYGRLRDELDLTTLTGELQRATVAAVEPASSALWLRSAAEQ